MSIWRGSNPSFFMATINPQPGWVVSQSIDPLDPVDTYEFSGDLATGIPRSTEGAIETKPAQVTKSKTSRAKK
jgi:hypothetical protein